MATPEGDSAPGNVGGSGGGGGQQSSIGGCNVDTRYPRSIEGILRIVTVVSRGGRTGSKVRFPLGQKVVLEALWGEIKCF